MTAMFEDVKEERKSRAKKHIDKNANMQNLTWNELEDM